MSSGYRARGHRRSPAWRPPALLGALAAITWVCWWLSPNATPVSTASAVGQVLGSLALIGVAVLLLITTRHRWIDAAFGGLDRAYAWHRWIAVASVAFAFAHAALAADPPSARETRDVFHAMGVPSLLGFLALSGIAVAARRMRYERWRAIHRFLIVPYAVGLVHAFGSSSFSPIEGTPLGLWMALWAVAGIGAALFSVFVSALTGFPHAYLITRVRLAAHRTVQVEATAVNAPLRSVPGQFAFVRLPGIPFGPHPFTISRSSEGTIEFTIKALGDHTGLLVAGASMAPEAVLRTAAEAEPRRDRPLGAPAVGDTLLVTRAHGRFTYRTGARRQVWIAAGIGITPFRAFLCAGVPTDYSVDLFYCFGSPAEAPYLGELLVTCPPHVRIHTVNSAAGGRLTAAQVLGRVASPATADVYFCGPRPMGDELARALRLAGVRRFHRESFEFRPAARTRRRPPA